MATRKPRPRTAADIATAAAVLGAPVTSESIQLRNRTLTLIQAAHNLQHAYMAAQRSLDVESASEVAETIALLAGLLLSTNIRHHAITSRQPDTLRQAAQPIEMLLRTLRDDGRLRYAKGSPTDKAIKAFERTLHPNRYEPLSGAVSGR